MEILDPNNYDEDEIEMKAALEGFKRGARSNAIMTIMPYRSVGVWVFDDPSVGLVREPFVLGIPEMIEEMTKDIEWAINGFKMFFSATRPPISRAHHIKLMAVENGGGWYRDVATRMCGWLCPATLKYFPGPELPAEIWVWVEAMTPEEQMRARKGNEADIIRLGLKQPAYPIFGWDLAKGYEDGNQDQHS